MEFFKAAVKTKENIIEEAKYQHPEEVFEKVKPSGNQPKEEEITNIIKRNITAGLLQLCVRQQIIINKQVANLENIKNAKGKNNNLIVKPNNATVDQYFNQNNITSNQQAYKYQEQAKALQAPSSNYEYFFQPNLNNSNNLMKIANPETSTFIEGSNTFINDTYFNLNLNWKVLSSSFLSGFSSKYNSVKIEVDQDEGFTLITSTNKSKCLVLSDVILENAKVYIFSCCFNKPLNGAKGIAIGLFDEEVHTNGDNIKQKRKVGDCYFDSCSGQGVTQIIKGYPLNSESNSTALTKIEFQVCIASQTFRISGSSKQDINQCSKESIDNTIGKRKYQLGIEFDCPVENDIEILVSEAKVYEFNL